MIRKFLSNTRDLEPMLPSEAWWGKFLDHNLYTLDLLIDRISYD